jgi:hypothetical protein
VTGTLLGVIAVLCLTGTGVLIAAMMGVGGCAELLLAGYVAAFACVVGLFLFLSAFRAVTQTALVAGSVAVFGGAIGAWRLTGRPRLSFPASASIRLPSFRRPVPVLAFLVGAAFAYVVALVVAIPPNGWDPLNYHLARAAFWLQSGRIGYIHDAYDQRMNLNLPNGEIGSAFALGVTHQETMVGFVQLFAALACGVGVLALARRLGLSPVEAAFGALLFLTLPIVVLQASVAKNDLVLASLLLAAAVFILGRSRGDIALGSLATALAVGTKFTALYGLPILVAVALATPIRERRPHRLAALAIGALAGSYWYVVNLAETGHLLGDQSAQQSISAPFHPPENVLSAYGMAVDTLDLSGARGADIFLYPILALVLAAGLTLGRAVPRRSWRPALLAAGVVLSPVALLLVTDHIGRRSLVGLYELLGKPRGYLAIGDDTASSPTTASDTASWFGPVGFLLGAAAAVGVIACARRAFVSRVAAVLAFAPLAWLILVALNLTYNPWLGRFFIFPVALSAALWGLALRSRACAWGLVALASTTVFLSLVHYVEKPSGLRLLDRAHASSVWRMQRWQVQSQHDPAIGPVLRYFEQDVPRKTTVALALGDNNFGYPVFGPNLERHVELVPFGANGRATRADWLLANPGRAAEIDPSCWRTALRSAGGVVFERRSSCPPG